MKRRIVHLIGVVLLLSLLLTGCNDAVQPTETPVNTPLETPDETPEETPYETLVETPTETPAETPDNTPFNNPLTMESEMDVSQFPVGVRTALFYFGNYNGVYVFDVPDGAVTDDVIEENIGEYHFMYISRDDVEVYNANEKKSYTLSEAYENGLLPIEAIRAVHEMYDLMFSFRYRNDGNPNSTATVRSDGYYYIDGVCTGIKAGISDDPTDRREALNTAYRLKIIKSTNIETTPE